VQNPFNLFFFENCLSGVESKGNDVLANRWMKDKTVGMPQMHSLTIQGLPVGGNRCGRLVWPPALFTRHPDLQELCLSNMDLRPQGVQQALDLSTLSRLQSLTMHHVFVDEFPALPQCLEVLDCRAWPNR
jgi:hypothetical protein